MKPPTSQHTTTTAIVRWYESKPQEHRPHMGASIIGHECERFIWLTFRWALTPTFPGRVLRLFETGRREESRLVEELRGIGATVWETDPDTGDQWRVSAFGGHFGGSLDGVAQGLPEAPKAVCVLEFKTHSHKSFTDLLGKKVKGAKPQHYDQMQVYMGLMELDRAMYMAVNKDTDDVYCEWVHFDDVRFAELMTKAQRLVEATTPPAKLSDDPAHWQCKFCNMHAVCHGDKAAEANCRTCCHVTPTQAGAWRCGVKQRDLPLANQRAGCDQHLMIPPLVPYAEPVDGGDAWVGYRHRDSGTLFTNGQSEVPGHGPNFASKELHHCPGELIRDMAQIKEQFPSARVVKPSPVATATAFDDMPSDDLDKVPTKAEHPQRRAARGRAAATLKALEQLK